MAQGSPGTDVALGRPEGFLGFAAAAQERGGTLVVMLMLLVVLMVVLTSPAFCRVLEEVCRSPRGRRRFQ